MDKTKLKAYLKCLYELEVSLYIQKCALNLLNTKINYLAQNSDEPYVEREIVKKRITSDHILSGCILGYIIVAVFAACVTVAEDFFSRLFVGIVSGFVGIPIGIPLGLIIGLIKSSKEAEKAKRHNEEVDKENDLISTRNYERRKRNQKYISLLRKEEVVLKENIYQTNIILQDYYGLNIVHNNYRGLVPISSIYGYFDTGTCSQLKGHEGAYNKYDMELKLNCIISKLDIVISHLEEIKQNQKMLYNAMCRANSKLGEISSGIDRIETKTDKLLYNSEVANQNIQFSNNLQIYNMLRKG